MMVKRFVLDVKYKEIAMNSKLIFYSHDPIYDVVDLSLI
jgi:hypothetical protein